MKIKQNTKNTLERLGKWNLKTLTGIRQLLFLVVLIDMFGLYWYLRLKSLSMAILIVCMIIFALVVMRESVLKNEAKADKILKDIHNKKGGKKKMDKDDEERTEEEPKEKKKEEDEEEEFDLGLDLRDSGLPDADEYKKRAEKALGTMAIF